MEKISNRALISRLFSSAEGQIKEANYDPQKWSEWYQLVQSLSAPEKMTYIIVKMNQTVTQGGFSNFYVTSHGIFAPEIIHVLSEINASATAKIVSDSLPIVNPSGLLDEAYKTMVFNIKLSELQKAQLFAQDIKYDQLQDIENLEDLLGNYLQEMIK